MRFLQFKADKFLKLYYSLTYMRLIKILILCFCTTIGAFANETIPDIIRRPQRGEAPRYPEDTIIGSLGRGTASLASYSFARNFLNAIVSKNQNAPILSDVGTILIKEILEKLAPINPQRFRLGGGREEADGSISFLVRFMGREEWMAGELYIRFEEEEWRFDDLLLEEARDISAGEDGYRFDFSPYERLF